MTDKELAVELIRRLNDLILVDDVRLFIERMIESRIPVSSVVAIHPTIQVVEGVCGFLGLLNGIVGTIPEGKREDWGYITAVVDDKDKLLRFELTI